jgi:hypothetical protein
MVCPKCRIHNEQVRLDLQKMIAAQYGKIDPQQWMEAHAAAQKPVELSEVFREDWDLGMNDSGKFYVSYKGRCQDCGFGFEFRDNQQVLKLDKGSQDAG